MTDAYRSSGVPCPNCQRSLRDFEQRLVCDGCGGMLLAVADFAQALASAGGLDVRVEDDTPTQHACPRCAGSLRSCGVYVGGEPLPQDIWHCKQHGLWLGGGMLADALASVGRREHRGRGQGRMYGGAGGGGYTVLKWWEKPRPMVHTLFKSTLAGQPLTCPACNATLVLRGMLWTCDDHGVFVENAALETMVTEMTHRPWQLAAATGSPGERRCPACAQPLVVEPLEGVTVDRCAAHGLWFDPTELATALDHAVEPAHGWFRRLFS
jgi:hypothetical protein